MLHVREGERVEGTHRGTTAHEKIPAIKKNGVSAPRVGVAIAIQPGVRYAVFNIYNKTDAATNGVIEAVTIDLPGRIRLTGTYISPITSACALTSFPSTIMITRTGRDCMMGDFNARDATCDTVRKIIGRTIKDRIRGTQQIVIAAQQYTYKERGRKGTSSTDLAINNMRGGTLEVMGSEVWAGSSDRLPNTTKNNYDRRTGTDGREETPLKSYNSKPSQTERG